MEDKCEKCGGSCDQITGAEAEQPYKGFDSNIALLKCTICHHEFEPTEVLFILKVGESYILRNGLKTGPIRVANNGTNYKFEANVKEPEHEDDSILAWLPNGRYLTNIQPNRYDVVRLLEK